LKIIFFDISIKWWKAIWFCCFGRLNRSDWRRKWRNCGKETIVGRILYWTNLYFNKIFATCHWTSDILQTRGK